MDAAGWFLLLWFQTGRRSAAGGMRGALGIDVLLPCGDEPPKLPDHAGLCGRKVVTLTGVGAQIVQQQIVTVDEQLPTPLAHRTLLTRRDRDAPEHRALEWRRFSGENRDQVHALGCGLIRDRRVGRG